MTPPELPAIAVLVVRDGVPPLGADEVVAEAGGSALLAGTGTRDAAGELTALRRGWCAELGDYAPGGWAARLAPVLADCPRVLLPGSPDGRDLAPRLAAVLDRTLLAAAGSVRADGERTAADLVRWGGRVTVPVHAGGPIVATLVPGVRGADPVTGEPDLADLELPAAAAAVSDARVLEVLPPDPATADLAEAPRILSAGAGLARGGSSELAGPAAVELLGRVAAALQASLGATRVVTDAGWTAYERQIGTTGVVVNPDLYVAFGVSGAAQHTGGLGAPKHIVSVNLDGSCPMTAMADLGIVTDAQALLTELAERLLGSATGAGAEEGEARG